MKRIIGVSIIIILLSLITYSVVSRIIKNNKSQNRETIATPVIVEKPQIMTMEKIYTFTGNLKPKETVTILSKIPGKIEKIFVKEGERVKEGQTVAKIEDDVVRLQLKQAWAAFSAAKAQYQKAIKGVRKEELENAEALVKQAEADFKTAEDNFKRVKTLYKAGTIPKAKYEETENQLKDAKTKLENAKRKLKMMKEGTSKEEIEMARSNMEAMKARYDLAKLQLDYTRITSPISGTVAHIFVTEDNMVNQTMPIMAIIRENPILAEINIPEKYYSEIAKKKKIIEVRIKPTSLPDGSVFKGKIIKISSVIDPTSRTFTVEAEINNNSGKLLAGMFVEANLVVEKISRALTVAQSAIVNRNGKSGVFVGVFTNSDTERAKFVVIVPGIVEGERVQIIKGNITESSRVITDGNSFLEDGQIIREVKER